MTNFNCFGIGKFWRRRFSKPHRPSQDVSPSERTSRIVTQREVSQKSVQIPAGATNDDQTPILDTRRPIVPGITIKTATLQGNEDLAEPTPSPHSLTPIPSNNGSLRDWDATSHRSRANSSVSNSSTEYWLKEQLREERLESHTKHKYIVPHSIQERLITVETVTKDLLVNRRISEEDAGQYAQKVCECAKRLYAVLALLKKGSDIGQLFAEGISDADLPLIRRKNTRRKFALYRQKGTELEIVKSMEAWKDKHLEHFEQYQWWMLAPKFKTLEHHEFEEDVILPFLALSEEEKKIRPKQGTYSEVFPVRIHPAHHDFWDTADNLDNERLVAVKQLFSDDEQEFRKEESILKAVAPKRHQHLINLLATFRQNKKYHLLFPYATANLRMFWEERPIPAFDRPTLLWSLGQMKGLASGLNLIHNFSVTYPLSVSGATKSGESVRLPEDVKLSVDKGEEMYGRHGDIKPENVLWFATEDGMGILKIADFGLGRFHGRDSRSGIPAFGIFSSPTYEPPECKLHLPVSRAYDIWSLGCIYMEFATWLLMGSAEIEGFSDFRGRPLTGTNINDDNFFTLVTIPGCMPHAIVRDTVVRWTDDLHSHPKCTEFLHDLVDFIMADLLVVESKDRCNARTLFQTLVWFHKRAEKDTQYLLKPVPRRFKGPSGRHNSCGAIEMPPRSPKRSSISFAEGEKTGKIRAQGKSKDLLLRNAGTPSFSPSIEHQPTWPNLNCKNNVS